ncbi:hypothetical protein VF_0030 [Aliivibrio fischeri ES114]|uniref:Uncharacterized protein n=1 Tax=Aliivibrio fischeri (strain ATCC 700601 / ES114) TaxID=312309 RepID=Q5E8X1_ALIF1|nr:hypothetical protein [Aliivibrio fischeri]AAW84525.1 hypothetical protein VF_0030 [Aliivibrio fischeri ES114]KLU79016.1 hypothetical protein AB192_10310 [Aliivibrio fischeri]
MGYDLGTVYLGQMAAKKMLNEEMYGKQQPRTKKTAVTKKLWKGFEKVNTKMANMVSGYIPVLTW